MDAASTDPFEAFKRKKQAAAEAKQANELAQAPRAVREDGRPVGFHSHRADFDKNPEAMPEPVDSESRPKGFKATKLADELPPAPADTPPKPKGFRTHKLIDPTKPSGPA